MISLPCTGAAFDQSQLDAVADLLAKLPQAEQPVLFADEMQLVATAKGPKNHIR